MARVERITKRVILAPDELQAKLFQLYLVIRQLKRMDAVSPPMSPGSGKKKEKERSSKSKNDRRSLSPGRQSDGSKRHLSFDRFEEFGEDKRLNRDAGSLSPKKESGYSSSPHVSRRVQRGHSSFAQGPQLDMRPLPLLKLSEESFPTFEHSTSMGDEQGKGWAPTWDESSTPTPVCGVAE